LSPPTRKPTGQNEEKVDADEKGPYILHSKVEKAIKERKNKKTKRDDEVSGNVLTLLGKDGLNDTTQQQHVPKKPNATNC
jgi:hypothetical protein